MPRLIRGVALASSNVYLVIADICVITAAPIAALALRVENSSEFHAYFRAALALSALRLTWYLLVFHFTGLYTKYWRYASVDEIVALASAAIMAWVAGIAVFFAVLEPTGIMPGGFPRSIPVIDGAFTMLGVGMTRMALRMASGRRIPEKEGTKPRRVLLAGAGVAGAKGVQELRRDVRLGFDPVAFVDDDPRKQGLSIHGVPVLGTLADIANVIRDQMIDEVVVAMPSAPGKVVRGVMEACASIGIPGRTMPGLFEIINGTASVTAIRDIEIDDLLRRGVVKTDIDAVRQLLRGKRILVTGAGGSIGSELCRQIVRCVPSELVLLEMGENPLLVIENEIWRMCADLGITSAIRPVVGDIRDRVRMDEIFRSFKPEILYHAAAHKHVALMEDNSAEAVTNNILGTKTLIELSEAHGLDRFVMISSDKAVRPTSVMGATKRVAELLVREAAVRTNRKFVAVRFGNVLGSRGSVVPLFKEQIARGGPVTVTSPDAWRFFMTIAEAAQLVLQAGAMGSGGEVFILDMGEPVRIADLARDLIMLSGLEVEKDIKIVFTGLKPGEKEREELFYPSERVERSAHEKISVSRFLPPGETGASILRETDVAALIAMAQSGDASGVRGLLERIVPEFRAAPAASIHARDAVALPPVHDRVRS